jgi:hypothetical protein
MTTKVQKIILLVGKDDLILVGSDRIHDFIN